VPCRGLRLLGAVGVAVSLAACFRPPGDHAAAINGGGRHLAAVLDSMHVERGWRPGDPVNWRTGEPDPISIPLNGHCSAFVAAVCARFDIYILRPPEHSERLLANAQCEWLQNDGPRWGWRRVADGVAAQHLANQGDIVVACCKGPDEDDAGHIAVVRPGTKGRAQIALEGPDIAQAGARNYSKTTVRHGFRFHPAALRRGMIRYYAHAGR